jgi:hypothetical protein
MRVHNYAGCILYKLGVNEKPHWQGCSKAIAKRPQKRRFFEIVIDYVRKKLSILPAIFRPAFRWQFEKLWDALAQSSQLTALRRWPNLP